MPASRAASSSLVGSTIGSYRVERRIGAGGMGDVYELVQPKIGKRLAAKVLHAELATRPEITARFFDEARAVNAIGHPGIVDIIDHGHLDDQRPYLVMELLEGVSCADLLRQLGPLPLPRVRALALEVLDALQAAHERGIIHRDLKPDNLFIGDDGRAKLLDFGIAKLSSALRSGQAPTRTGELLGTPRYMAPEQASGQVHHIDARTDIYAMGAVLYELLSGQPPFDSETLPELIEDQLHKTPTPIAQLRRDLPAAWRDIIDRAMAKSPNERFPSAEAMKTAISAAESATTPAPASRPAQVAGPGDPTVLERAEPTPVLPASTRPLPADQRPTQREKPRRPASAGRPSLALPLLGLALATTVVAALMLWPR